MTHEYINWSLTSKCTVISIYAVKKNTEALAYRSRRGEKNNNFGIFKYICHYIKYCLETFNINRWKLGEVKSPFIIVSPYSRVLAPACKVLVKEANKKGQQMNRKQTSQTTKSTKGLIICSF